MAEVHGNRTPCASAISYLILFSFYTTVIWGLYAFCTRACAAPHHLLHHPSFALQGNVSVLQNRLPPGVVGQNLELVHRAALLDEIGAAGVLDAVVERDVDAGCFAGRLPDDVGAFVGVALAILPGPRVDEQVGAVEVLG